MSNAPNSNAQARYQSTGSVLFWATMSAYAIWYCAYQHQRGAGWAGPAAIVAGIIFLTSLSQIFVRGQSLRNARRRFGFYKSRGHDLANARYATIEDARSIGLLSKVGIFLGTISDRRGKYHDLRYDGQNSVCLIGPPAAIKSMSVLATSLLPTFKLGGVGHSCVVNDIKGELFAICHRALEAAGYRVLVACAWSAEMSKRIGIEIKDIGIDLWSDLDLNGTVSEILDVVTAKAKLTIADEPKIDAKDRFFKDGGRELFEFIACYIIAACVKPTMAMMRQIVMEGAEGIIARCQEAMESDALDGALAELASSVHSIATTAPEQFAGYLGTCKQGLEPFKHNGPLGSHFIPDGLDPKTLRDDQKTILFIIYPPEKTEAYHSAIRLTFSHILAELAADSRVRNRVTLFIEECAALGYIPNLLNAINTYRGFGIRCVLVFQELAGQAEKIYGSYTVKEILAACEVLWMSRVREPSACEMASKRIGETNVEGHGFNASRSKQNPGDQPAYNRSHQTRPLARPDEVERFPADEALIFFSGQPAIRAKKVPYWTRRIWNRIAGRNPYRQGGS
ncbi:type IV secretory system conjugative DNA transfer family protein [Rhodopirellula bahusiensis]|uniref:type IV secretory system conjugative DNA transfer family protein n=1 Tax=Rhodopirellula bahusiensis TaxID=2014065 RepID=UPI003265C86D